MEDGKLNEQIELGDKREKCIYCLFHHSCQIVGFHKHVWKHVFINPVLRAKGKLLLSHRETESIMV